MINPAKCEIIGAFKVDFIPVTHSLADAVAFAIETPQGTVIHTGDFKLDQSPIVGNPSIFIAWLTTARTRFWLCSRTAPTANDEGKRARKRSWRTHSRT